jgi:hypothetical protein
MVVRSAAELEWIKDILLNLKTTELATKLDKIIPNFENHYRRI